MLKDEQAAAARWQYRLKDESSERTFKDEGGSLSGGPGPGMGGIPIDQPRLSIRRVRRRIRYGDALQLLSTVFGTAGG